MANIAIVNYCNLKCPYCFADDMIQEKKTAMTVEDYCKVLEFLSRTPRNYVGIIGGEPTLHPNFKEILKETNKYCKEVDTGATLFTNGINLEPFMGDIGERIGILVNCNGPEYQPAELFKKQREVLDHMDALSWFDKKVTCGCNIHPGQTDYSYFWDIVKRYKLRHVRISVVSPAAQYECYRSDKEAYYNMMRPIFVDFCKEAIKHECILNMDCGHIPMCYFTMEEREIVEKACEGLYQDFCHPVIDITPDFKATACFGAYETVDMRDFKDLEELDRYLLLKHTYPRAQANCTGKCATCKKHELLQCQGGCLGFANLEG
jgi:sulfatase maturation enzyme AslB (radical SAM superfamily)